MNNTKLVLALLGALAMPLSAAAADTAAKPADPPAKVDPSGAQAPTNSSASPMFRQLDANHDGYISLKEAGKSATVKAKFKSLDSNHDGKVSIEEWAAGGMD